jgi:hypothetical protein
VTGADIQGSALPMNLLIILCLCLLLRFFTWSRGEQLLGRRIIQQFHINRYSSPELWFSLQPSFIFVKQWFAGISKEVPNGDFFLQSSPE